MRTIIAACTLGLMLASLALAADVDWKLYGAPGGSVCFYEANGVTRTTDRHIGVWTKCLPQTEIDNVDFNAASNDRIVNNVTRKVLDKYVPPIALVQDLDHDQIVIVIGSEEIANLSPIQPNVVIYYELNCSERMVRRLTTYVRVNGREGFDEEPSDWEDVEPEGNVAMLLKLLCRMR